MFCNCPFNGYKYCAFFIDAFSHYTWICAKKKKSKVTSLSVSKIWLKILLTIKSRCSMMEEGNLITLLCMITIMNTVFIFESLVLIPNNRMGWPNANTDISLK